jgi:hypothetical protein
MSRCNYSALRTLLADSLVLQKKPFEENAGVSEEGATGSERS